MWWRFKNPKLESFFGTPVFSARRDGRYVPKRLYSLEISNLYSKRRNQCQSEH